MILDPFFPYSNQFNLPGYLITESERLDRDRINIMAALKATNGRISGQDGAASLLEIKPAILASRMKTLGINKSPV